MTKTEKAIVTFLAYLTTIAGIGLIPFTFFGSFGLLVFSSGLHYLTFLDKIGR